MLNRENPDQVSEEVVDQYEETFANTQKELKRYLNENYNGNFSIEDT